MSKKKLIDRLPFDFNFNEMSLDEYIDDSVTKQDILNLISAIPIAINCLPDKYRIDVDVLTTYIKYSGYNDNMYVVYISDDFNCINDIIGAIHNIDLVGDSISQESIDDFIRAIKDFIYIGSNEYDSKNTVEINGYDSKNIFEVNVLNTAKKYCSEDVFYDFLIYVLSLNSVDLRFFSNSGKKFSLNLNEFNTAMNFVKNNHNIIFAKLFAISDLDDDFFNTIVNYNYHLNDFYNNAFIGKKINDLSYESAFTLISGDLINKFNLFSLNDDGKRYVINQLIFNENYIGLSGLMRLYIDYKDYIKNEFNFVLYIDKDINFNILNIFEECLIGVDDSFKISLFQSFLLLCEDVFSNRKLDCSQQDYFVSCVELIFGKEYNRRKVFNLMIDSNCDFKAVEFIFNVNKNVLLEQYRNYILSKIEECFSFRKMQSLRTDFIDSVNLLGEDFLVSSDDDCRLMGEVISGENKNLLFLLGFLFKNRWEKNAIILNNPKINNEKLLNVLVVNGYLGNVILSNAGGVFTEEYLKTAIWHRVKIEYKELGLELFTEDIFKTLMKRGGQIFLNEFNFDRLKNTDVDIEFFLRCVDLAKGLNQLNDLFGRVSPDFLKLNRVLNSLKLCDGEVYKLSFVLMDIVSDKDVATITSRGKKYERANKSLYGFLNYLDEKSLRQCSESEFKIILSQIFKTTTFIAKRDVTLISSNGDSSMIKRSLISLLESDLLEGYEGDNSVKRDFFVDKAYSMFESVENRGDLRDVINSYIDENKDNHIFMSYLYLMMPENIKLKQLANDYFLEDVRNIGSENLTESIKAKNAIASLFLVGALRKDTLKPLLDSGVISYGDVKRMCFNDVFKDSLGSDMLLSIYGKEDESYKRVLFWERVKSEDMKVLANSDWYLEGLLQRNVLQVEVIKNMYKVDGAIANEFIFNFFKKYDFMNLTFKMRDNIRLLASLGGKLSNDRGFSLRYHVSMRVDLLFKNGGFNNFKEMDEFFIASDEVDLLRSSVKDSFVIRSRI